MEELIRDYGYWGLFLLIVLESTAVPIPSLLVMPFAGYLAARGTFSLPLILVINGVGAATGSMLSYWFGAAGGTPLLLRWGRFLRIKQADLDRTHAYFERHGSGTIFVARFLPVIRHVISIPAGIARMPVPKFLTLTVAGAMCWGGGLMVVGYELGDNWKTVVETWHKVDLIVAGVIVAALAYLAVRFFRRHREPGS